MMKSALFMSLLMLSGMVFSQTSQDTLPKVIQFSGIITEGDSLYGISGAAVIQKSSGRGTSTNLMGYFSIPVLEGDSIIIAALGYKKHQLIIPDFDSTSYSYSVLIQLIEDTLHLPVVNINAFPSEAVFKEVLLAMELPDQRDYDNMQNNLNERILERLVQNTPTDGSLSHRYYMDRQANALQQKYLVTTNPLLDPFAWARFVKDIKEYRANKKREDKEDNNNSAY